MKRFDLVNSLSSFRAQMVTFITLMLLLAIAVLSLYNLQVEKRTTDVVGEYIRAIPVATGLVFRSLFEGENLYDLVNQPDPKSLAVNSESSIRHIFVVDGEGKIYDSADENDKGKPLPEEFAVEARRNSARDLKKFLGVSGEKQINILISQMRRK